MQPDPSTIETFAADGAVKLAGLFDAALIARLSAAIDDHLTSPGPLAVTASPADDPGRFFEDFRNWRRFDAYLDVARAAAPAAAALMRSRTVRLHHDHLLVKAGGTLAPTPWHQDQPYYDFDGRQVVSLWIPVDPVPADATLRFVAGSHLGPWLMPRTFLSGESRWFPPGSLAEIPDVAAHPERHRILAWPLQPGDATAFHMLALHAAGGSARLRRVLSLRFIGDDVVWAPRRWTTSPPFPELAARLRPGGPLNDPLFPLLWEDGAPA